VPDTEVPRESGNATGSGRAEPLTRERLYELVWSEPMLRVAERFGVSSTYMARVCADLRVPRPARGYWAQREFGKALPETPPLPIARPGDVTAWTPGVSLSQPRPAPVRPIRTSGPSGESMPTDEGGLAIRQRRTAANKLHELVVGAKPHFLKTRKTEAELLRPYKRLLVDIVVSEKRLDAALSIANDLFLGLEAKGHRVTFSPPDARMRRAQFDVREVPSKNHYYYGIWSPDRITVVYIGNVPIGLTLFETTEEIEAVYDHGKYLPVRDLSAAELRRYQGPHHWRTKQEGATGRFWIQAYCPHQMVAWKKQWRVDGGKDVAKLVPAVILELETAAPFLVSQVAEAEARAEAQRRQWAEESRLRREEEERRRQAKLRQNATSDLLAAIDAWDRASRIQDWFAAVERQAQDLTDEDRLQVLGRVDQARALIGGADPLELLKRWKTPAERQ
jgi:hypothetical protein